MADGLDTRLPFPIPFGWFRIGSRDELAPGQLVRQRYFGRELIWWRDGDGRDSLVDAYCPHLGAHLGYGGRVDGDRLACPFHGWQFDAAGSCVAIPYARRIPPGAKLRSYPVCVRGPFVFAWFHPRGEEPHFALPDVPELGDPAYGTFLPVTFDLATHPQELAENAYDPAHFATVHGHPQPGEIEEIGFENERFWVRAKQIFPSSKGPVDARNDVDGWGPGFSLTRFSGVAEVLAFGLPTPIEDGRTRMHFSFVARNPEHDPKIERVAEAFVTETVRQLQQDKLIWENKCFREKPPLRRSSSFFSSNMVFVCTIAPSVTAR